MSSLLLAFWYSFELQLHYIIEILAKIVSHKCIYVPDQVRTLAQVGTSPNLGWPNKELTGSEPIYELFCPSWDPLGIPTKQKIVMLVSFLEVQGNSKWRNVLLRNAAQ